MLCNRWPGGFVRRLGPVLLAVATPVLQAQENGGPGDSQGGESGYSNTLSFGGYYSRGDYGAEADSHVTYLPLSWEHSRSPWRFNVTVPWLKISGPGNVLVNTGGVSRPGRPDVPDTVEPQRVRDSGPGDVLLRATWEAPAWSAEGPFLDLGVEVKLPTADETRGLGTGATDTGLQLDLYQQLGETTTFATLGHRWRGTSEWFVGLQDTWWASLGFSSPLVRNSGTGEWSWGMIYDYREAASTWSVETHELLPYLTWSPDQRWSVMGYVAVGFTRDSAEQAVGLQLSWRW